MLDVYGMDRQELMQALSAMTENDKLSIPAYLESKGAWVTEIGNQDTREYGEYHPDVRYNTDTEELFDMKERKAIYDKAMEPINANDVIVKFVSAFESEWEILKITNLSREDVGNLLKDWVSHFLRHPFFISNPTDISVNLHDSCLLILCLPASEEISALASQVPAVRHD